MRFHARPRGAAQRLDIAVVELAHGLGHQFAAGQRGHHAHRIIHQFGNGASAHAHHRSAAGHGFDGHEAEGFGSAGMHQCIHRGQHARELDTVATIGQHGDIAAQSLLLAATDQQQVVATAQPLEGIEQYGDVLLAREAAGESEQAHVRAQAQ